MNGVKGFRLQLLIPKKCVVYLQDIKGQFWNDDDSEGDNESEEFLYGVQVRCIPSNLLLDDLVGSHRNLSELIHCPCLYLGLVVIP